jgi:hypothetical protein
MRALIIAAIAGFAAASAASAQPNNNTATLCLDTIGVSHPATCHTQQASRLNTQPDICQCLGPWREVKAPWCGPNEKPPAESHAFEKARLAYAKKHHDSVVGGTYNGQSMCVKPGNGP